MSLSLSLSKAIHDETDARFFPSRISRSVKAVLAKRGALDGGLRVCAFTAAQLASVAFSYFCMEGTVRSLISIQDDPRPIVRLRPLGDAGGWISLTVFSALAMKNLFEKLIGHGEYIRIKSICLKWIQDNRSAIENNLKFREAIYGQLMEILREFSSKRLFNKNCVSRCITALNIYKHSKLEESGLELSQDRKLETIFRSLQNELGEKTDYKHYFQRLHKGWKQVVMKGRSAQVTALIFGIVLPMILLSNVVLSLIGEFGLGKELFYDREELEDTGHFGEWPINAVEALAMAFFLHIWYLVSEGDFMITREIYANRIEPLADEGSLHLHNRLCSIANEELSQIASSSAYSKLANEYQFEKL